MAVRLSKVTYPDGREVFYNYGIAGSIGDVLNRIDNIAASATPASADIYANYAYLGAGTIVRVFRPSLADGLTLNYDPDHSHTYSGWDRFGRVVNQQWTTTTGGIVDQYRYGYDEAGNRVTRANELNANLTETYTYDELSRLIDTDRGEDEQQVNFESWSLDQLGNWTSFCGPLQDPDNPQTRLHNEANEITSIDSSSAQVAYDAVGNMIRMPSALDEDDTQHAVYDAWNRMTKVYLDDGDGTFEPTTGDTLIATYAYDGQRRRIVAEVAQAFLPAGEAHDVTDFYYNENWQVVEERGTDTAQEPVAPSTTEYVWDIRYIDAPVIRRHDANSDDDYADAGDNVVYYVDDANMNVTALVDAGSGLVVERYAYQGYGNQTVLKADWSPDADNASDVGNTRGFAGAVNDVETGLVLMRWRYTHTGLGRFTTNDSLRSAPNLYEYCFSSPVAWTDSYGLTPGQPGTEDNPDPGRLYEPGQVYEGDRDFIVYATERVREIPGTDEVRHKWYLIKDTCRAFANSSDQEYELTFQAVTMTRHKDLWRAHLCFAKVYNSIAAELATLNEAFTNTRADLEKTLAIHNNLATVHNEASRLVANVPKQLEEMNEYYLRWLALRASIKIMASFQPVRLASKALTLSWVLEPYQELDTMRRDLATMNRFASKIAEQTGTQMDATRLIMQELRGDMNVLKWKIAAGEDTMKKVARHIKYYWAWTSWNESSTLTGPIVKRTMRLTRAEILKYGVHNAEGLVEAARQKGIIPAQ